MAVNKSMVDFADISSYWHFRLDFRFLDYTKTKPNFKSSPFRNFVTVIGNGKDISPDNYADYNSTDVLYPSVNNFRGGIFRHKDITFINEDYGVPKSLEDNDIIISRSGTVGITYVWNKEEVNKIFGREVVTIPSGYLIVVRVDERKLLPKFVQYYFNSTLMLRYFNVFGVGKTQKNIAQPEILAIPIPNLAISTQAEILKKIQPIEIEITKLKQQIKPQTEVMNMLFVEALAFDIEQFNQLKNKKLFSLSLEDFASETDTRFGCRFHNKAGQFVEDFLKSKTNKRIKDFISEPIVLGSSVSPNQYEEEGHYFYVAMSNIKNWQFEEEDCKRVGDDFYKQNIKKTIQVNDILMARSGEGTIGKVAIIEDEEAEGVFADFTMRIRLTGINPLFAYYYFRTEIFQHLVYTHKKGLGNNTNIFPSQVKNFSVPDFSSEQQEEIVSKIKKELNKQKDIEVQILEKQAIISKIIEDAIKVYETVLSVST